MPKVRVIPTILTDGISQVKGAKFDNWRTVGSVVQAIKLYSSRDVDELVLVDVVARSNGRVLSETLVAQMSRYLRIPFSVGGGVDTVEDIECLLPQENSVLKR
jgi:cyclase